MTAERDTVDAAGANRVLGRLGSEAQENLDKAQEEHVRQLALLGALEARASSAIAAAYVAPTMSANGLELIVGRPPMATSGGGTTGDVLFGTLFGSSIYRQFPPPNATGYYLIEHIDDLAEGADPWGDRDSDALGEAIREA